MANLSGGPNALTVHVWKFQVSEYPTNRDLSESPLLLRGAEANEQAVTVRIKFSSVLRARPRRLPRASRVPGPSGVPTEVQ
jgi:hypothetical protein